MKFLRIIILLNFCTITLISLTQASQLNYNSSASLKTDNVSSEDDIFNSLNSNQNNIKLNIEKETSESIENLHERFMSSFNKVKLIALNKITAQSKEMIVSKELPQFFGNMKITLHKCVKVNDLYKPDNQALLTLIDFKPGEDDEVVYQGWMLSSSLSTCNFQHPIYEIFIKDCL